MPSPTDILQGLTVLANRWEALAVAWHVAFLAGLVAIELGWRPTRRLMAVVLLLPLGSVGVVAWASGNPFNGVLFGVLVAGLGAAARAIPRTAIEMEAGAGGLFGAILLALGVVYPHFLDSVSWIDYLASAPLGLVPCATLLAVSGVTLLSSLHRDRRWTMGLAAFALGYGLLGALYLGVLLDLALVAGGVVLLGEAWARHTGTPALMTR